MGERSVSLQYGQQSVVFGWKPAMPARDFGTHLAEAVKGLTGLQSLQGLDMYADLGGPATGPAPPGVPAGMSAVKPRDLFEGRVGGTAGGAKVFIAKSVALGGPAVPAPKAVIARQPPVAGGAGLLKVPRAGGPVALGDSAGSRSFQKKGGAQFQFMRIMQMDKDPAGLQGASAQRRITMDEVAQHSSSADIWMVLSGRVFNVTPYMDYHPGGKAELMRSAGTDGTALFREIHPWVSVDMIDRLQVGILEAAAPRVISLGTRQEAPLAAARPGQAPAVVPSPASAEELHALSRTAWRAFPLLDRQQVTPDCLLLKFDLGQARVSGLLPGQHLTVRMQAKRGAESVEVQRQYTPVSDADAAQHLELLVKVYPTGKLGPLLAQLRPGADRLEMQGPFGDLVYLRGGRFRLGSGGLQREAVATHAVMVAAGSGITPMWQLLRTMVAEWREGGQLRVTLVFCNRREEDVIFRRDLELLASEFARRLRLRLLLSEPPAPASGAEPWPGRRGDEESWANIRRLEGRISDQVLSEALAVENASADRRPPRASESMALVCGGEGFTAAAAASLSRLGMLPDRVHVF